MRGLSRYIGANTDIPAGDIGVTSREIGWMFGTYKAETSLWEGCITGKDAALGGSLMKPEATGYGLIYVRCSDSMIQPFVDLSSTSVIWFTIGQMAARPSRVRESRFLALGMWLNMPR